MSKFGLSVPLSEVYGGEVANILKQLPNIKCTFFH